MAREGCLDRRGCGFLVPDLTDQNHVGVEPHRRPQAGGERHPGLDVDLHLIDLAEPVLHRVLDGEYVARGGVQLVERGIQGRRLARAGRSADEHHAEGQLHQLLVRFQRLRPETQLRQRAESERLVQQPQHGHLAVDRGCRGDTHVQLSVGVAHRYLAVLGAARLGDVHPRDDLDARDERRVDGDGQGHDVVQDAVDPEPDADLVLLRLDVDVRGAVTSGLPDEQVDGAHDGRLSDGFGGCLVACLGGRSGGHGLDAPELRSDVATDPVVAVDRLVDVPVHGQGGFHRLAEGCADLVDLLQVTGVGHRDMDGPLAHPDRDHTELAADPLGHHLDRFFLDLLPLQVDEGDTQEQARGNDQLLGIDHPLVVDDLKRRAVVLPLERDDAIALLGREHLALDQHVEQRLCLAFACRDHRVYASAFSSAGALSSASSWSCVSPPLSAAWSCASASGAGPNAMATAS